MGDLPSGVSTFANRVADDLVSVAEESLVGIYVHGSATLGDFTNLVSDVDLLVLLDDDVQRSTISAVAEVLNADRACPGIGLEASAVRASDARLPRDPWPFLVHVCTIPGDAKVVFGSDRAGDPDLILHYLVTRAAGVPIVGPPPVDVLGEVASTIVTEQLADELRWAVRHASGPYAVLNACRALRYQSENAVCSKIEGGEWALARAIEPGLVQPAIDARRRALTYAITPAMEQWVLAVADTLSP